MACCLRLDRGIMCPICHIIPDIQSPLCQFQTQAGKFQIIDRFQPSPHRLRETDPVLPDRLPHVRDIRELVQLPRFLPDKRTVQFSPVPDSLHLFHVPVWSIRLDCHGKIDGIVQPLQNTENNHCPLRGRITFAVHQQLLARHSRSGYLHVQFLRGTRDLQPNR